MTAFLPPNLLALFEPRSPLRFIPVPSTQAKPRRTYDGIAECAMFFEDPKTTPATDLIPLETVMQRKKRIATERKNKQEKAISEKLEHWDPNVDTNATKTTDPYHTLFVSRLSFETTEETLKKEFEYYGPILKLQIVRTPEGKSRGYAFIEYERERDMKSAYKQADRKKIDGRRVIVDMERGRTIPNWRPRRLGGGLGGRPDILPKSKLPQEPERQVSSYHGGGGESYQGGGGGGYGSKDRIDSYRPNSGGPRGGGGYGPPGGPRTPRGGFSSGGRPDSYRPGPPRGDDRSGGGYSRDSYPPPVGGSGSGRDSRDGGRDSSYPDNGYSRSRDGAPRGDYRDSDRDGGYRRDEYRGGSSRREERPRGEERRGGDDRFRDERSSRGDERSSRGDDRSSRDHRGPSRHFDSRDSYRSGSRY